MKKLLILSFFAIIPALSMAQYNMRPSAYFQDMLLYNPASLPEMGDDSQRLLLYSRTKFIPENEGIWEKSPTFYADYLSMNDTKNSYFTIGYMNDKYSFFSRNSLHGGYGRIIKLGENSNLTLGGRFTLHSDLINWSNYQLPNNETGRSFRLSPDIDVGAQFQLKAFKLGASVRNTIGISQEIDEEGIITTQRAFVVNTSYDFTINEKFVVAPYVLLYTELKTEIDAGLFLSFERKVNFSYLLRVNELRSILTLEGRLYRGLSIGAAYDQSPLLPSNNLDIFFRYFL
ncbi:type IX secretion system membrane protein PorP/SprF [Mongoliibacter ruber]|uniref:Type IX secretion system PorP/SprF family membrane protein n=1 Tax=Mongoliibacter ruber TaxID=1750599 RepID=A0A2T0WMU1_9BACT|nr:type IX secretion system membrane protein PorP/SprF [Mongoliibacter ruber]PRY88016.1 type IX secretion system PorP/SprF family membrane protein [Mongoliibacter ruber]